MHSWSQVTGRVGSQACDPTRIQYTSWRWILSPEWCPPYPAPSFNLEFYRHDLSISSAAITQYPWGRGLLLLRDPTRSQPSVMMHLKREDVHARARIRHITGGSLIREMRQEIEAAVWDAAVWRAALSDESPMADEEKIDVPGRLASPPADKAGCQTASSQVGVDKTRADQDASWWATELAAEAAASGTASQSGFQYKCHSCHLSPDGTMLAYTDSWVRRPGDDERGDEEFERCRSASLSEPSRPDASGSRRGVSSSHTASTAIERPVSRRYGRWTLRVVDVTSSSSGRPSRPPVVAPVDRAHGPLAWSPDSSAVHFIASGGSQLWTLNIARSVTDTSSSSSPVLCSPAHVEPQFVFEDPDWHSLVFRRLSNNVTAALCLGSDMKAVQALLLTPSGHRWERGCGALLNQVTDSQTPGGDLPHDTGPAEESADRSLLERIGCAGRMAIDPLTGVDNKGPYRTWTWCPVPPARTRGSRIELHPIKLPPYPTTTPIPVAHPESELRDSVVMLQSESPSGSESLRIGADSASAASVAFLICLWDVDHPLGQLQLQRLGTNSPLESSSSPLAPCMESPEAPLLTSMGSGPPDTPSATETGSHVFCPGHLNDMQLLTRPGPGGTSSSHPGGQRTWLGTSRLLRVEVHGHRVMTVHKELGPEERKALRSVASSTDAGDSAMMHDASDVTRQDARCCTLLHFSVFDVVYDGRCSDTLAGESDPPYTSTANLDLSNPAPHASIQRFGLQLQAHCAVILPVPFIHILSVSWHQPHLTCCPPSPPGTADKQLSKMQQQGAYCTARLVYSSLGMMGQVVAVPLHRGRLDESLVVPPDGSSNKYTHERLWAISDDGTPVPISLVHLRRGLGGTERNDDANPCYGDNPSVPEPLVPRRPNVLLRAYGAFGLAEDLDYQAGRSVLIVFRPGTRPGGPCLCPVITLMDVTICSIVTPPMNSDDRVSYADCLFWTAAGC